MESDAINLTIDFDAEREETKQSRKKLHCFKSQPIFSDQVSQTEWGEPFDFPTEISGFSL